MSRLLFIDDDQRLLAALLESFEDRGHACTGAATLASARSELARLDFDLILLDVMLPDGDGWDLLTELRQSGDTTRVIFLSARHRIDERVRGLQLGATDYIIKPFELPELEARVEVALRRERPNGAIEAFGLHMDLVRRRARLGDERLDLTPKEFDFLASLIRAGAGNVVPRDDLLRDVWDLDEAPKTNVIEVLVTRLRRKLDARGGPTVTTQKGVGYALAHGKDRS